MGPDAQAVETTGGHRSSATGASAPDHAGDHAVMLHQQALGHRATRRGQRSELVLIRIKLAQKHLLHRQTLEHLAYLGGSQKRFWPGAGRKRGGQGGPKLLVGHQRPIGWRVEPQFRHQTDSKAGDKRLLHLGFNQTAEVVIVVTELGKHQGGTIHQLGVADEPGAILVALGPRQQSDRPLFASDDQERRTAKGIGQHNNIIVGALADAKGAPNKATRLEV